jgi:hypothetical protein
LKLLHLQEQHRSGEIDFRFVSGSQNVADLYTKSLTSPRFTLLLRMLGNLFEPHHEVAVVQIGSDEGELQGGGAVASSHAMTWASWSVALSQARALQAAAWFYLVLGAQAATEDSLQEDGPSTEDSWSWFEVALFVCTIIGMIQVVKWIAEILQSILCPRSEPWVWRDKRGYRQFHGREQ